MLNEWQRPIVLGLQSIRWDFCRLSSLESAQVDAGTCTKDLNIVRIHGEGIREEILGEENNMNENKSCSQHSESVKLV